MKVSKTVDAEIRALYAILAARAARKAIKYIEDFSDAAKADTWAEHAVDWMKMAGATGVKETYMRPTRI